MTTASTQCNALSHRLSRSAVAKSIYGWGQTQALPLMFQRDSAFLKPIRLCDHPDYAVKNEQITHVAAGWGHSLIGTEDHVYGFGVNSGGQLGCKQSGGVAIAIQGDRLKQLACGREHSHILLANRGLYSMGSAMYGQLGTGLNKDSKPGMVSTRTPMCVQNVEGSVEQIACGLDSTVYSTDTGSLFAMGWGADGQLGLGKGWTRNKDVPCRLPLKGRVRKLAGSTDFTLALMTNGELWTWGNSEYGQCMQGVKIDRILEPTRVEVLDDVIDVAAGGPFSVILTEGGTVFTCGYGALGLGQDCLETLIPRPIPNLGKVARVYATTDYAAALTDSGELYTWGLNDLNGRLGVGDVNHVFSPRRLDIDRVVTDVVLGTYHAYALTK